MTRFCIPKCCLTIVFVLTNTPETLEIISIGDKLIFIEQYPANVVYFIFKIFKWIIF